MVPYYYVHINCTYGGILMCIGYMPVDNTMSLNVASYQELHVSLPLDQPKDLQQAGRFDSDVMHQNVFA
jgi:hypothetical protein